MSDSNNKAGANPPPGLPVIQIESPCPADWNAMTGDEAKRFCGSCQKHVHHLSKLTTPEINELLCGGNEVCIRMELRADGSMITRDNSGINESTPTRRHWLHQLATLATGIMASVPLLSAMGCKDPVDEEYAVIQGDIQAIPPTSQDDAVHQIQGGLGMPQNPNGDATVTGLVVANPAQTTNPTNQESQSALQGKVYLPPDNEKPKNRGD